MDKFRNDIKRLGLSAEQLQGFRGMVNALFLASLVLEPGWTLTAFYTWLDTFIPFTDGMEKGKESLATAAALQSEACRKSGLQHWIDFNENNQNPMPTGMIDDLAQFLSHQSGNVCDLVIMSASLHRPLGRKVSNRV